MRCGGYFDAETKRKRIKELEEKTKEIDFWSIEKEAKKERSFQEWNLSKDRAKKILEPLNLEYQGYNKNYNNI